MLSIVLVRDTLQTHDLKCFIYLSFNYFDKCLGYADENRVVWQFGLVNFSRLFFHDSLFRKFNDRLFLSKLFSEGILNIGNLTSKIFALHGKMTIVLYFRA